MEGQCLMYSRFGSSLNTLWTRLGKWGYHYDLS